MSLDFVSSALFGQTETSSAITWLLLLARLLVGFVLPYMLGHWLAKRLHLKDYAWKLCLIFCSLACAAVVVQAGTLKLGVDLKGGVILIYQVDRRAIEEGGGSASTVDWAKLLEALTKRINPSGTKEIVLRRYGEWQVEIVIPDVDPIEIERLKKLIETAGQLEFRIVANRTDHTRHIEAAYAQEADPARRYDADVRENGKRIARWCRVARDPLDPQLGYRPLKVQVLGDTIRDAMTGKIIRIPPDVKFGKNYKLENWLDEQGIEEIDFLMVMDDGYDMTGEYLGMVTRSVDETLRPCVSFNTKGLGAGRMGGLTSDNSPDKETGLYRRLGIILDGTLLSAPRIMSTITDRGRITGQFTQQEVDDLVTVLQAGSLPAAIQKNPISENQIGAILGEATIRAGTWAIGISLLAVLLFILWWYRFAGFIACLALGANLLLILAFMMTFGAALTLPGLAGLVLTVGMSVDANVLIYERIREEEERGAAVRLAIRNGFSRATTTIVDANLTTLITGIVLYAIGTDQIRGFAVTLILGIVMSMYTAIFCSRVVFEILERARKIKVLNMRRMVGDTHIDFIGKRHIAAACSIGLILIGLVCIVIRGKQIFDIDFLGGTSATIVLNDVTNEDEIRTKLDEQFADISLNGMSVQYSVNRVDVEDLPANTVWKVDSSLPDVDQLKEILASTFNLAHYSMKSGPLSETQIVLDEAAADQPATDEPATDQPATDEAAADEAATDQPATDQPATDQPATDEPAADQPAADEPAADEPDADQPDADQPATDQPATDEPAADEPAADEPDADQPATDEPAADEPDADEPDADEPATDQPAADEPDTGDGTRYDLPSDRFLAMAGMSDLMLAQADSASDRPVEEPTTETKSSAPATAHSETQTASDEATTTESPAEPATASATVPEGSQDDSDTQPAEPAEAEKTADESGESPAEVKVTRVSLTFGYKINYQTLKAKLLEASAQVATLADEGAGENPSEFTAKLVERIQSLGLTAEELELTELDLTRPLEDDGAWPLRPVKAGPDWHPMDSHGFKVWDAALRLPKDEAETVLMQLEHTMTVTPVIPSSSLIGGKVAGDMRTLAFAALVTSLLGIILYIWVRFQRVVFGLAAVIALVHDVLITLGAIAVSYWLAPFLGFLQIEEFKISLPVVAALLTIIGYSLNDTIVIFDRIRETRGKSPNLTIDMINFSINQTLSRTLLTSLTTFIVVLILYMIGGPGIHGFAFSLVVGVVVGTYSSTFVAAPILLWISKPKKAAS